MPETRTCLWFDTQGLEAAEFYVSIFPRSEIQEVTYWGSYNAERQGQPLEILFTLDGREFTALNGGPGFPFTEAVSIQVECDDQDELDRYWDRLLEGGGRPVQCGWLTDRYGLSWQVTPRRLRELMSDPDEGRATRAATAMMEMVKLDVAALERAADTVPDRT